MTLPFPTFQHPVIAAPMAGGPSTPALVAAVSNAGGFAFLGSGYKTVEAVRSELAQTRELTPRSFGLNLFVPSRAKVDSDAVQRYLEALKPEAARYGVELGTPRYDDDGFESKVELAIEENIPVVSFAFGCPPADVIARLHARGTAVWVTVTELEEALIAERSGADALVVQGVEAGGHRGSYEDRDGVGEVGLLALLRVCARRVELPLVAAGGIGDGPGVAAVLAAGARAAQIGTAFLRCPEAGTSQPHRAVLETAGDARGRTRITRAFTGRRARGLVNRFMQAYDAGAPAAYPEIVHVTKPLRALGVQAGDPEILNLWAGQAHALSEAASAAELTVRWSVEARDALESTLARLRFADRS